MEVYEAPPNSASLFQDPTPNEIILNRIIVPMMDLISNYSDFGEPQRKGTGSDLIDLVVLIARKMWSVWKHAKDYHTAEDRLVAEFSRIDIENHVLYSQELFEEFDVYAVQIKSTLDHLARVFRPILRGEKTWTVQTWGDSGDKVLNELKNLPKARKGYVQLIERMLFTHANRQWIETIVGTRDKVNHYKNGGIDIRHFAIARNPDGSVRVPMWVEGQALGAMIDITWSNFFHFVEDFLALAIKFRMPDEHSLLRTERPLSTNQSAWTVIPIIETKP